MTATVPPPPRVPLWLVLALLPVTLAVEGYRAVRLAWRRGRRG